jgi:hypothetical protein
MAGGMATAVLAAPATAATNWLCNSETMANTENPCLESETATIQTGSGSSSVEHATSAKNAPIDCFYVYPTVSSQETLNANTTLEPFGEEKQIAIDQASRFSQVCKVYAPRYEQITITNVVQHNTPSAAVETAYNSMLSAWKDYLSTYNKGRGVVLIGHSQGAVTLIKLMKNELDANTPSAVAERAKLVSAVLLGANATVKKEK